MFTKKETERKMNFCVIKSMLNDFGLLHGGELFKMMDTVAGYCSKDFSGFPSLTKSVNNFTFLEPAYEGDKIRITGIIDYTGRTSMEVYLKAEVPEKDNAMIASGYFTMVAIDRDMKATEVPKLILESEEDRMYNRQAIQRRNINKSIDMSKERIK